MHSSAFFRTIKPAIRVLAAPQNPLFLRSIFTKSNASNENPTVFGSGLIIAASTIALYYISSSSHHISYADSGHEDLGNKSTFLFGDSYRKKVFFKYEKRLRLQSPPEKVHIFKFGI